MHAWIGSCTRHTHPQFLVVISRRSHPIPSRTRKLSSLEPMVLLGRPSGRVGRRQDLLWPAQRKLRGLFLFVLRDRRFAPRAPTGLQGSPKWSSRTGALHRDRRGLRVYDSRAVIAGSSTRSLCGGDSSHARRRFLLHEMRRLFPALHDHDPRAVAAVLRSAATPRMLVAVFYSTSDGGSSLPFAIATLARSSPFFAP